MRLLVTAGPTREPIDAVRFLSNPSTGRMGCAVVQAALDRGWSVTLVLGPVPIEPPAGADVIAVTTALQMFDAAQAVFAGCDAAVFTAAVCDHRPAQPAKGKLHKDAFPDALKLVANPDIAATLCRDKRDRIVVGFALESHDAEVSALRKLKDKHLDYIVVNSPSSFGAERARAWILGGPERIECDNMPKIDIARAIVTLIDRAAEPKP